MLALVPFEQSMPPCRALPPNVARDPTNSTSLLVRVGASQRERRRSNSSTTSSHPRPRANSCWCCYPHEPHRICTLVLSISAHHDKRLAAPVPRARALGVKHTYQRQRGNQPRAVQIDSPPLLVQLWLPVRLQLPLLLFPLLILRDDVAP